MREDDRDITVSPNPVAVIAIFLVIFAIAAIWFAYGPVTTASVYGASVAILLGGKLFLSLLPSKSWDLNPSCRVGVIVPFYNEDPDILLRGLESIYNQTHSPRHIYIVDDGSDDLEAFLRVSDWIVGKPAASVVRIENRGKRHAMAEGFRGLRGKVDVFLCVDSDTVLDRNAIKEGVAAFSDPEVAAATGTVIALNPKKGLLPRLLDLRYVNAFLYERAAYSKLGSVLCVCGSLAFWRASVIDQVLDRFLSQEFLGESATFGDDRHLTNLSLLYGKVVLARNSVARTAVPERGGHLIRQQIRWGKSFFRESWWSIKNLSPRKVSWWLAVVESVSWAGFTTGLFITVVILPLVTGQWHIATYLGWVILAGYGRSVHVFSIKRPDWTRWEQLGAFLMAPLYGMVHVLVLMPLRIYSLVTIRNTRWGTRQVVEVAS